MDRVTPAQARKGFRTPPSSFPENGSLARPRKGIHAALPYCPLHNPRLCDYPSLPTPCHTPQSPHPPSRLTAPREPLYQPPCLSGLPGDPPTLGGGRNGDGEGRGLSSQAGKQGLLKWPQQACWYLKDSGEGGGQRLGGSLPGGW